MDNIEQTLKDWQTSLMASIPYGGLMSRNPIAYKWKAAWRCWLLREAAFWRETDLLTQSYELHQQKHGLGARILLRSGFETLAMLIYLNHIMRAVIGGQLEFHQFCDLTTRLLIGTKTKTDQHEAINILKMLDRGDKKYPGLRSIYDDLSESAHPNFDGMLGGYSKVDRDEYETNFSNRWMELHSGRHLDRLKLCMMTFHLEYNETWPALMEKLESWIVKNDTMLEATKSVPASGTT